MAVLETVFAVHNFEAENDDELTFQIGESVIVIHKDDGFNDGWWKGENMRGEVGLFPMNYITFEPCHLLPTPSSSDTTKKSSYHNLSHINTSISEELQNELSPSVRSSYSFTCPVNSMTGPSSTISNISATSSNTNHVLRRSIINTLFLPTLRSNPPEEWDIDQVKIWLNAMNFGSIADTFKSQEITGDILLELNMDSLKELNVLTFGKRFKIHTALAILRDECGYQLASPVNRMSMTSSTYSDDLRFHQRHQSPTSPTVSRYHSPINHRQSSSYHSNLIMERHHHRQRSERDSIKKEFDEEDNGLQSPDSIKSPLSDVPTPVLSPTSNYDIMEASSKNYENDHRTDQKTPNPDSIKDVAMIQTQKRHTVLPMAHRSSMDIYSTRTTDDCGNVTPDMEGWLHKQGCKYKKWNKRWFVLKGPNLFYFKSPKDVRMKGIINLRGYRIVPDETIQPGKYSFKAQHEEERTFYFYTDIDINMKAWISSLMKATISRDFTAPVLSSSMIPTVSLDVARRMRPRPPSVLLYRKENLKNNTNLSPQSYEATYGGYHTPISKKSSASSTDSHTRDIPSVPIDIKSEEEELTNQDSGFDSDQQHLELGSSHNGINTEDDETEPFDYDEEDEGNFEEEFEEKVALSTWTSTEYIQWIHTVCTSVEIDTLSDLRQGDVLIEVLEELSGKRVKQLPTSTVGSINMLVLDNIVAVFKFMSLEGIEINDQFTIKDIFSGKEDKIKLMLQAIIDWSIQSNEQ
ncbi:hypothetical protein INT48_003203 [Thamnidium elegans]|uniref:Uncharacterized protein n=1 Tax=Thamnidium elegans TaxID=101142 RepID=A0A8H7VQA9_9FUNG|nr:hypothetical protein INT48_003203 [Thamnidium elegans]